MSSAARHPSRTNSVRLNGSASHSPLPLCYTSHLPFTSNITGQHERFSRAFKLLTNAIAEHAFPSASVAVLHRNELVALKGFGRFTFDNHAPEAPAANIYDLASVSKVVATTTMAAILYERGR